MQIVLDAAPTEADRKAIQDALVAFNRSKTTLRDYRDVAVLIRDDAGATIGGLSGYTSYRWMFIELLFVPEHLRGQDIGTQLMAQAEAHARSLGLVGIWLDTFSFQARPFYEKLGYSVFGTIPDYPPGGARYFLSKTL
ncbi:MAG: family acetyltransferase [Devosia sp.]|uniref:GNAT family N-acetyltransferase n=1 Tax=Devosia sp. TaxID=1871048 RepID=UPI002636F88A|nr:GNAT family N-acetyltransferase [Devosia sp.]MDB5589040.1 family acetyltransferase [Devosia sp.]